MSPNRGMEQLVARWAHNPKVTGSSPVPATSKDSGVNSSESFSLNTPLAFFKPRIALNTALTLEVR